MTGRFNEAVEYVWEHEGGFNNIKGDKGGATNWGVSLKFLKHLNLDINNDGKVDWLDIKGLTKEDAKEIYFQNFWKPLYDTIPYRRVAIKLFDIAINAGSGRSNKLLQRALKNLGSSNLKEDGLIGKNTLGTLRLYTEEAVLKNLAAAQLQFYKDIVTKDPTQKKFIKGWTNRANWVPA